MYKAKTLLQNLQNPNNLFYQYGKYEESEAQYKKALDKLPKSEEKTLTAYNLSKVLYDDKNPENKYGQEINDSCKYAKCFQIQIQTH